MHTFATGMEAESPTSKESRSHTRFYARSSVWCLVSIIDSMLITAHSACGASLASVVFRFRSVTAAGYTYKD